MQTATAILTALIKSGTGMDDLDRTVAMSAYLAKKLEADMLKPLETLEQEVWPVAQATETLDGSEAHADNNI